MHAAFGKGQEDSSHNGATGNAQTAQHHQEQNIYGDKERKYAVKLTALNGINTTQTGEKAAITKAIILYFVCIPIVAYRNFIFPDRNTGTTIGRVIKL